MDDGSYLSPEVGTLSGGTGAMLDRSIWFNQNGLVNVTYGLHVNLAVAVDTFLLAIVVTKSLH